jgi:hypothetical protein
MHRTALPNAQNCTAKCSEMQCQLHRTANPNSQNFTAKCSELHCQMRRITIPVGQFCISALLMFYVLFQVRFYSKSDMVAGLKKKKTSEQAGEVLLRSYV